MPGPGAEVPLQRIVLRGAFVYTVDMAEVEQEIAACNSVEIASWVGSSLSAFHGVPLRVEPVEERLQWAQQVSGHISRTELRSAAARTELRSLLDSSFGKADA